MENKVIGMFISTENIMAAHLFDYQIFKMQQSESKLFIHDKNMIFMISSDFKLNVMICFGSVN